MQIRGQVIRADKGEEHIIRRLGGAVLAQWRHLPKGSQERIIRQAGLISDPDETVQLDQQIKLFIKKQQEKINA